MATIKDVAKLAGVSVATVSRVINNSNAASESAHQQVIDAIEKLDYKPNLLGRNLRRTETRLILVLLPTISNPFYARIVNGIEDIAHKNGYNIMLCNTESDSEREMIYLDQLKNRLSDGVIFMGPEIDKNELTDIGRSFPVVQCCEYKRGAPVSHVSIDNLKASYTAMNHLIDLGHRRIGLISADNHFVSTEQREQGYRKALEDSGINVDEGLIKYGDYSFESGYEAAGNFIEMQKRPTAIFAISDTMAIGAIKSVKDTGLHVPKDISVMGFDNISFSSMSEPLLTTIHQPKYNLGCEAMELILKQIKGEMKEPEDIFLDYELKIRESTGRNSG